MAKIAYQSKLGLSAANAERLATINGIIEEYLAEDYVMTLRQLYYQLVRRNVIANNAREYAKISILLGKGRMAGIVDWDAIEDRGRRPKIPYWVTGISEALNDTANQYRLDRMKGQSNYIEVWIEKDALSNIFSRVTEKYHIRLMVNKGYSSISAMHESYKRFKRATLNGQKPLLIYFGDHDPSGKDMVRDVNDRLVEFGLKNIKVINPALSYEQVQDFSLPENPAKITDPRAKWYIEKYGEYSWELDALEPQTLVQITEDAIKEHINMRTYRAMLKQEEEQKTKIEQIASDYE